MQRWPPVLHSLPILFDVSDGEAARATTARLEHMSTFVYSDAEDFVTVLQISRLPLRSLTAKDINVRKQTHASTRAVAFR